MKERALFLCSLTLSLLAGAFGCEDPDPVTSVVIGKPPPGSAGPREIAFVGPVGKQGNCIRAMAVDGSNVATIICPGRGTSLTGISWEPAGTAIAYVITGIADYGLWRVNVDGTNAIRLLSQVDCPGCSNVAWSPHGDEIAVISNDGAGASTLLLLPATGCPWPNSSDPCPRIVHSKPTGANVYFSGLAWSPDGTQLAMGDRRGPDNQIIVIVEPGLGPGPGTVTEVAACNGTISDWGRGQRSTMLALSVIIDADQNRDIYFLDVTSPALPPQVVVQHASNASFSPDGEFIVYREMSRSSTMMKRELDAGTSTVLLRESAYELNWRKPGL